MKIDVLGVQAFLAVAELKNFRKAALRLNITQTALSRRLQNLEGVLGVRLVERTTRSMELTPWGREFLPRAREFLAQMTASLTTVRELGRAGAADPVLAYTPSVNTRCLTLILRRYKALFPTSGVKLLDLPPAEVPRALARRQAQLGMCFSGEVPGLRSQPVAKAWLMVACLAEHPLARLDAISWGELGRHRFAMAAWDDPLQASAVSPEPFYSVQSCEEALALAEAGVVPALVPMLPCTLESARLRFVPLVRPVVGMTLRLHATEGMQSPRVSALADLIVEAGRFPAHELATGDTLAAQEAPVC